MPAGGEITRFEAMPWENFLRYMETHWEQGQHIPIIGPTGEGKTTVAVPLMKMRKWVMALDPKGKDETLQAAGFPRITSLPLPRKIRKEIEEGKPCRLIVGGAPQNAKEDAAQRELFRKALDMIRRQGGWTLYVDEFQELTDRRMMNLGTEVERLLIMARGKKTSVISSFQAPAWVPKAASRQATHMILLPTRSRAMIKTVAEDMGRNWEDLYSAIDRLPKYYLLVIRRSVHAPILVIHPPKLH